MFVISLCFWRVVSVFFFLWTFGWGADAGLTVDGDDEDEGEVRFEERQARESLFLFIFYGEVGFLYNYVYKRVLPDIGFFPGRTELRFDIDTNAQGLLIPVGGLQE
jgi:hypothetical protein